MFFSKKTNKQPKSSENYDLTIDNIKNELGFYCNLQSFLDGGYKLLSLERENINEENEETVLYAFKNDEVEDFSFPVSRFQHKELLNQFESLIKKNHD